MIILTAAYLVFLAIILAMFEIEIEGKYGWAEKLQTWYRKHGLLSVFYSKKPFTGYHIMLIIFVLALLHTHFILANEWSLAAELMVLSYAFVFFTSEDFLWFMFNPYYGIKNFKKSKIWWHNSCTWVFGLFPIDYVYGAFFAVLLAYLSSMLSGASMAGFFQMMGWVLVFIAAASILLPGIYMKWHSSMRKKGDRKNFNIFH